MPQIINTNVASLNAQRNLNKSQGALQTSLQRLSSGLRINSAKDDAAGLAISDRMTAQIRGMNQASRNAADAISLAQTGEGALQEITNNLQRMRELAVQSRNATNTDADRASLDAEYQQLLAEVDRIATTTAFNGRKVLDGSLGSSVFQVGANVGETIAVDVSSSMRTNSIGSYAYQSFSLADSTATTMDGADVSTAASDATNNRLGAGDALTINGTNVYADILAEASALSGAGNDGVDAASVLAGTDASSAAAIVAGINRQTDVTGVTASTTATTTTLALTTVEAFAMTDVVGTDDNLTYSLTINGVLAHTQGESEAVLDSAGLANAINGVSGQTGVTATLNEVGDVVLAAADGRNIVVGEALGGDTDDTDAITGYFGGALTGAAGDEAQAQVFRGEVTLRAAQSITLNVDDEAGDANLFTGVTDELDTLIAAGTIDATNIRDEANVDQAILRLDAAIGDVDTLRGTFGSIQSRFESTIASLQVAAENVSAARSRILDADFAQETAALTKNQILQQAGVSVLAQANGLPQNVLALLQ
jgi:flagellin